MPENKMQPTDQDVDAFIAAVENDRRRADSHTLIEMMSRITGEKPRMWGPTIVGFGEIRYTYDTGRTGTMGVTGFSPRKDALSIYLVGQYEGEELERKNALLARLGKHKMGKACLYVKKLSDIDMAVLEQLVGESVENIKRVYPPA